MSKSILIVGAGLMQIPAIRIAKEMGLHVIATDGNPEAPGFAHADLGVQLDTKDPEAHREWALANRHRYDIRGAFAGADVAVTVAAVTEALGLPGIPLEVARRSNNKAQMKERWLHDGIPTPRSIHVRDLSEAREAGREIGYPLMVKAIDNAASRGTRRIDTDTELPAALEEAMVHSTTGTALIEELVEGPEQSVELIADRGTYHRFGVVDRQFGFFPFPIELGHTNPSRLPMETQEALFDLTVRAAASLGIDHGPCKSDTILTRKGPMVLELPARLSGGFHSMYTTPLATGMNPIRAALHLAIGEPFPLEEARPRHQRATVCRAQFPQPGRVQSISGLDEARAIPGVDEIFLLVKEGDEIKPYQNCANRVCYVIATGKDAESADAVIAAVERTIQIETTPLLASGAAPRAG